MLFVFFPIFALLIVPDAYDIRLINEQLCVYILYVGMAQFWTIQ